jgi:nucleobase:cation symporter-1, NCS1 family
MGAIDPATIHEAVESIDPIAAADRSHSNSDLAPTKPSQRHWGTKDIAALWISMAACIPTYTLASSLIEEGMNWWQALATIFLGNLIVLLPMVLNAHAGTKYGIPFPIYCRASFGILGANVPALLRALVACGWFGIQSWIGGWAIYKILAIAVPSWEKIAPIPWLNINYPQIGCFLAFWAINMVVIYLGIDSIRLLLNIKAPLLIVLGLALLAWAYNAANGFGPMLSEPSQFEPDGPKAGQFWMFFFPALTGIIAFWATLSLNIPDFTRYATSQKAQVLGQALGLPLTMALYSFIGVAVTSATKVIYGELIWDPIDVLSRFRNPLVLVIGLVSLCLATLATNIAANVVSPANDFAHLWPRRISFKTGGLFTGVVGILIQPWKLFADPTGYIYRWLVAYSMLLGAIGGILITDYYLLRRTRLDLKALYRGAGKYWYSGGFNPLALIALVAGIAPCVPGFLGTIGAAKVAPIWISLYHYAWFISFGISAVFYAAAMKLAGHWPASAEAA